MDRTSTIVNIHRIVDKINGKIRKMWSRLYNFKPEYIDVSDASTGSIYYVSGGQLTELPIGAEGEAVGVSGGVLTYITAGGGGGSGDVVDGGQADGTSLIIGTTDAQELDLITNNTSTLTLASDKSVTTAGTLYVDSSGGNPLTITDSSFVYTDTGGFTMDFGSQVFNFYGDSGNTAGGNRFQNDSNTATIPFIFQGPAGGYSSTTLNRAEVVIGNPGGIAFYTASSGAGELAGLRLNQKYNLTGTASGVQRGLHVQPTFTSLGGTSSFRGVDFDYDNASAYGIYQSGTSTKNRLYGEVELSAATTLSGVGLQSTSLIYIGNSTGQVFVRSTSSAANGVLIDNSSTTSSGSVTIGSNPMLNTTGTRAAVIFSKDFNPTSGTANYINLQIDETINQTGGANGNVTDILINPTFTSLGGTYKAIDIAADETNQYGIYQSGSNMLNLLAGETHIGAGGVHAIYTSTGITTQSAFTIGDSNQQLNLGAGSGGVILGGGSGQVTIQTTSAFGITLNPASSSNAGSKVTVTGLNNVTSGSKTSFDVTNGTSVSSGTGEIRFIGVSGTVNQGGTASGNVYGIHINNTLTSVLGTYYALGILVNASGAKGVYQSGSSTTNNFVGPTAFGATGTPTEAVEVTGNVELTTAGNKLIIATGSNASVGTATLSSGTITVNTTAVTANSIIFISRNTPGGTLGNLSVPSASITAGTSFVINSDSGSETSTVNWWIVN